MTATCGVVAGESASCVKSRIKKTRLCGLIYARERQSPCYEPSDREVNKQLAAKECRLLLLSSAAAWSYRWLAVLLPLNVRKSKRPQAARCFPGVTVSPRCGAPGPVLDQRRSICSARAGVATELPADELPHR